MATKGHDYQDDLDSEFDSSERERRHTWRDDPLSNKTRGQTAPSHSTMLPPKTVLVDERDREEARSRRYHLLSLDAYSRHKMMINRYLLSTGKTIKNVVRSSEKDRNDYDVLCEEHRFLWDDTPPTTWEEKLAKTYYDRLFKEYSISDLSRYKENKVALRWRTEGEVIEGKGQFVCGNRRCDMREELTSWEVNFGYMEKGEKKNALVKLRLCLSCSKKLNYHHAKRAWKRVRKEEKREKKRKRRRRSDKSRKESSSSDDDDSKDSTDDDGQSSSKPAPKIKEGEETERGGDVGEIWNKSAKELVEKTKEEEFDDYFKDMFM